MYCYILSVILQTKLPHSCFNYFKLILNSFLSYYIKNNSIKFLFNVIILYLYYCII